MEIDLEIDLEEKIMRATNLIHAVFTKYARIVAARRRQSDFTCGDCEQSDRCGLPPSDDCIVRAAQMERGDWKIKRRGKLLRQW